MKNWVFITTSTFILFLTLNAFGQRPPADQEFRLTYLRGVALGNTAAFIRFDQNGRRFTGNTGCNIMNGNMRLRGNSVSFSQVITTKRACVPSTAAVEGGLLSALSRSTRIRSSRNVMHLYAGNRLLAVFRPQARPSNEDELPNVGDQLQLEDRKWVLESIGSDPVAKVEQEAFVRFDPSKSSAGGNTSCNVFGGTYKTDGDKLVFTETISTMRACIEDERMTIERGFLNGLRDANRYAVKADKLYLYRGTRLLLIFQGRKP